MSTDNTDLFIPIIGVKAAPRLAKASIRKLAAMQVSDIVATYGLSERNAVRLKASTMLADRLAAEPMRLVGERLTGGASVFRHFHGRLRTLDVEQFHAIFLNGKHRVIGEHLVSQGTLTASPVHPREVFRPAIQRAAAAIVLVHNHPSGDPSPSVDDLDITRRLVQVGDVVGIRILDHVIVGDGAFVSLADRGLME